MEKIKQQYLTEQQVAEITGFALSTLRNARCYRKGIPYRKIGKSVRYLLQDILDFMEAGKIETEN